MQWYRLLINSVNVFHYCVNVKWKCNMNLSDHQTCFGLNAALWKNNSHAIDYINN